MNNTLKDILCWRKPLYSVVVLASVLVYWLTFAYFQYSLLTFLCRCLQIALIFGGAVTLTRQKISSVHIHANADEFFDSLRPFLRYTLAWALDVIMWSSRSFSLSVLAVSFVLGCLGNYISFNTFIILFTVLSFTLPTAYQKNKNFVDSKVDLIRQELNKCITLIKSKEKELRKKVHHTDVNAALETKLDDLAHKNQ